MKTINSTVKQNLIWMAVAHLGFLMQGAQIPKVGTPIYYLTNFFLKTAWKWKKLNQKGGVCPSFLPHPRPSPPMYRDKTHIIKRSLGQSDVEFSRLVNIKPTDMLPHDIVKGQRTYSSTLSFSCQRPTCHSYKPVKS